MIVFYQKTDKKNTNDEFTFYMGEDTLPYESGEILLVADGLGGRENGVPREDGYDITVASEIMAVF